MQVALFAFNSQFLGYLYLSQAGEQTLFLMYCILIVLHIKTVSKLLDLVMPKFSTIHLEMITVSLFIFTFPNDRSLGLRQFIHSIV